MSRTYSSRERLFGYGAMWLSSRISTDVDYQAVSTATGIPTRTLRRWWTKPAPPGFAVEPTRAPSSKSDGRAAAAEQAVRVSQMSRAELVVERLTVLYHQLTIASEADAAGPAANVAVQIARTVGEMLPDGGLLSKGPEHLDAEEYREWLLMQAEQASDQDIELIMSVYARRHDGRLLLEGKGGHRAKLSTDGVWQRLGKGA